MNARELLPNGPARVIVNEAGGAVSPKWARDRMGIEPSVIFIRADGWALGAPPHLEMVAYRMWRDDWRYFMRCPSMAVYDIADYHRAHGQEGGGE